MKALVRGGTKGRPLREPGRGAVEHHQFAEGRLSVFSLAGLPVTLKSPWIQRILDPGSGGVAGNFPARARAEFYIRFD